MTRGGKRLGAGRRAGTGKFGEATQPLRVPMSLVEPVLAFLDAKGHTYPLYASRVQAGFPSPADDYMEGQLNVHSLLVKHPAATFFVRVQGDSMIGAGIHEGDLLVVDRSLTATSGKVVIAVVNGELTVKRLHQTATATQLLAENPNYPPILITEASEFTIWGVVTNVIHAL